MNANPLVRDSLYITYVEMHLDEAEAYADRVTRKHINGPSEVYTAKWNRAFHLKMDQLCARDGIRVQAYQGAKIWAQRDQILDDTHRGKVKAEVFEALDAFGDLEDDTDA